MNTNEVCAGYFTTGTLQKILPAKSLKAYDDILLKENLRHAKMENMVACRGCGLQVQMPEDCGPVLTCVICKVNTCRYCGEDGHEPLKCNQVEKKSKFVQIKLNVYAYERV